MFMKSLLYSAVISGALLTGCASVPMESIKYSNVAKYFLSPAPEMSGIYVYRRYTIVGAALKKDVWIDYECIGESSRGTFFYHEVEGDKEHTISTEAEFSPNDLVVNTEKGKLYFIEQYIKPGVFGGRARLKQTSTKEGKFEVSIINLAKKGKCSAS